MLFGIELYLSAVKKLGEPREVKIYEVPAYVDNASGLA